MTCWFLSCLFYFGFFSIHRFKAFCFNIKTTISFCLILEIVYTKIRNANICFDGLKSLFSLFFCYSFVFYLLAMQCRTFSISKSFSVSIIFKRFDSIQKKIFLLLFLIIFFSSFNKKRFTVNAKFSVTCTLFIR